MQAFIARQPIFDASLQLYAYELLFRSGSENFFFHANGNQATGAVISHSTMLIGLDVLAGGYPVFVNVTRDILLHDFASFLPKESAVLEVLEDTPPQEDVLAALRRLKEMGYRIALDDFQAMPDPDPFIELADIIKVDFLAADSRKRKALASLFAGKAQLLAEKVETHEDYREGAEYGYSLFQGYFFSKPLVVKRRRLPESKVGALTLLRLVNLSPVDFERAETIIKRDLSLSFKLLKYINSAFFGVQQEIRSIRQALVMLGERNVRRWASLIALACMGEEKPTEIMVCSILRGRFCELLMAKLGLRDRLDDALFLGLFSLVDAMLDQPLSEILKDLPLSAEVKAALQGERNLLRHLLNIALAYERGDWPELTKACQAAGVDEADVPECYNASLALTREIFREGVIAQTARLMPAAGKEGAKPKS